MMPAPSRANGFWLLCADVPGGVVDYLPLRILLLPLQVTAIAGSIMPGRRSDRL